MIIKPTNAPELFVKLFGEVDRQYDTVRLIIEQEAKAAGWDAAINHVFLQKPIQRKTPLTHPTN